MFLNFWVWQIVLSSLLSTPSLNFHKIQICSQYTINQVFPREMDKLVHSATKTFQIDKDGMITREKQGGLE